MKYLIPCAFILIVACKTNSTDREAEKTIENSRKFIDSIEFADRVDSMVSDRIRNVYFDTVGVAQGPVKITSAKLVSREYSSSKDIRLVWKNVSSKKISAIRFRWYGLNAFNEPADMGISSLQRGFGSGFTDTPLSAGRSDSGTWEIMSKDGKKVVAAWPFEVAFEDGSKWKSTYTK
jgi:hypothetical protein